ncbi:MAG TPA: hypothetical protein VMV43_12055 [Candidatus Nanopelagicaceae bacterium]|nr:hypothetical protein [Candidatus Nanopelagicaceae bacterium]
MTFDNLGPLLEEARTPALCNICNNYIYKRVYHDENSKNKRKVVFVCKNCLKNNEK